MNAIQSYIRHLIVTGLVLLIAKYKLPVEGSAEAANALALGAIGTVTWLVIKYAPPGLAKLLGFTSVLCLGVLSLPSCVPGTEYPVTATFSYRDPASGAEADVSYAPRLRVVAEK